uniref:C3H1-type domain-containing protein n=1 Tax=Megaselia scalaris TaxID=36166 RepID=T1GDM6_MEGSC
MQTFDSPNSCDADSAALARYVMALLKKDKSIEDLKQIMVEQLDVFLNAETQPFVKRLFEAIQSNEYLESNSTVAPASNPSGNINQASAVDSDKLPEVPVKECTPPLDDEKSLKHQQSAKELNSTPQSGHTLTSTSSSTIALNQSNPAAKSLSPFKASDKENQPRGEASSRRAPRRTSLRSRSRSRSRSNERLSRRSRSRERARINERDKTRQFRNKSPPASSSSERDRSRRSFNHRRGHGDSSDRSPRRSFKHRSRSPTRSRSPSVDRGQRKTASTAAGQSPKRQRCRDFDDKGYCVRGETCPWDHGINPVRIQSDAPDLWTANGNGPNAAFGPRGGFPGSRPPANVYGPRPGLPGGGAIGGAAFRPGGPHPGGPMFPGFPGINPANSSLQRELIPIPVVDGVVDGGNGGVPTPGDVGMMPGLGGPVHGMPVKRRYEMEDNVAIGDVGGMGKRKLPINSRLGPRVNNLQNNCSLELRKVPRGMNTIAHLNNHFAKFGKIVNIQVSYEGDPEAAIVTFSTHAEANVAYRSTEAVLNNRFIKVFWHSSNGDTAGKDENSAGSPNPSNGRKSSQYHLNNTTTPTTATPSQPSADGATTPTAAHVPPSSLRLKKNGATPTGPPKTKAAVAQMAHGLTKRKQELMHAYMQQIKSAVEFVEKTENMEQRAETLSTIKSLQEKIDKIRKEIEADQAQVSATIQSSQGGQPIKKSKEQAKKELLDVELELIALQQEGGDTTVLQKRYDELSKYCNGGKTNFAGVTTGSRPIRPTRPILPVSTSVDRRPKALVISGFDKEDCDAILGHFR